MLQMAVENSKTTIVTQEMDKSFAITLEYIKLSEYQWFFNNFSYEEILQINTTNIYWYIEKTSVKHTMSPSVVNKICIMASILKQRSHKIKYMLRSLDTEESYGFYLVRNLAYLGNILHYPIPNKNCVAGADAFIQIEIILIIEKYFFHFMRILDQGRFQTHIGYLITKYLACLTLIKNNPMFTQRQIEKTMCFVEILKYKMSPVVTKNSK